MTQPLTRRGVLATTTGLAALPVLSACGADEETKVEAPAAPEQGTVLVAKKDVPVGGCAVNSQAKVVVTQPTEGEFRAFSAICTHQGCLVDSSSEGEIPCNCHGSRFSLTDGSVLAGEADSPLPPVEITFDDDDVKAV